MTVINQYNAKYFFITGTPKNVNFIRIPHRKADAPPASAFVFTTAKSEVKDLLERSILKVVCKKNESLKGVYMTNLIHSKKVWFFSEKGFTFNSEYVNMNSEVDKQFH